VQNAQSPDEANIPFSERALLRAQPKPDCEGKPPTKAAGTSDPDVDLALRIKLEYEKECYRQAEMRVREQLTRLQAAVKSADRLRE
jgi:hypothetical protein